MNDESDAKSVFQTDKTWSVQTPTETVTRCVTDCRPPPHSLTFNPTGSRRQNVTKSSLGHHFITRHVGYITNPSVCKYNNAAAFNTPQHSELHTHSRSLSLSPHASLSLSHTPSRIEAAENKTSPVCVLLLTGRGESWLALCGLCGFHWHRRDKHHTVRLRSRKQSIKFSVSCRNEACGDDPPNRQRYAGSVSESSDRRHL